MTKKLQTNLRICNVVCCQANGTNHTHTKKHNSTDGKRMSAEESKWKLKHDFNFSFLINATSYAKQTTLHCNSSRHKAKSAVEIVCSSSARDFLRCISFTLTHF